MTQKKTVTSGTLFREGADPAGVLYVSSATREASSFMEVSSSVGMISSVLLPHAGGWTGMRRPRMHRHANVRFTAALPETQRRTKT